jgi:hypothetical protein
MTATRDIWQSANQQCGSEKVNNAMTATGFCRAGWSRPFDLVLALGDNSGRFEGLMSVY